VSAIEDLRAVIRNLHGCDHVATVPVHEIFQGKTLWQGEGAYQADNGQICYRAVLRTPPVNSPHDAGRAAIVAQVKNERNKRKLGRPRLPKAQVKNVIAIRVTDAEQYEARASQQGLRVSDWIRQTLQHG